MGSDPASAYKREIWVRPPAFFFNGPRPAGRVSYSGTIFPSIRPAYPTINALPHPEALSVQRVNARIVPCIATGLYETPTHTPVQAMIDTPSRTEIALSYSLILALVGFAWTSNATSRTTVDPPAETIKSASTDYINMIDTEAELPIYAVPAKQATTTHYIGNDAQAPTAAEPAPSAAATMKPAEHKSRDTWHLHIASFTTPGEADRLVHQARIKAINASKEYVTVNGRNYWRVSINGFASKGDAASYAALIRDSLDLRDYWIGKAF
jgi:cell division septation protein DedD